MLRRFLLNGLLLLLVTGGLYLAVFWALCRIPLGGTPLIHRVNEVHFWKGGNGWRKYREFDPSRHYDVIVIGSSHAYRGIDPRIFQRHGFSAFNLGTSDQTPMSTFSIVKQFLTRENTGTLVIDVYEATFETTGLEGTSALVQDISSDRAAVAMALALKDPRAINMLTLRWMMKGRPPVYQDSAYATAGFSVRTDPVKGDIHYPRPKPWDPLPQQQRYFLKTLDLCHRRGIPVVLVDHPFPTATHRPKHEQFNQWLVPLAQERGLPYLDFAYDHGLPLDDRHHFYDHTHLNQAGVEIFNEALIGRMERMGSLRRATP